MVIFQRARNSPLHASLPINSKWRAIRLTSPNVMLLGLASRFDMTGQMAAMGGFASKMGLASGPVVTALLLGDDNYELIIIVASVVMVITTLAVWMPARLKDRVKSD